MSFARYPLYRDSGVEWLGNVPAHWEVTPLKHVVRLTNGAAFKPTDWADTGVPIIRIENLNGGRDFNFFDGELDPRCVVEGKTLLFGWSGNRGTSFGPFQWDRVGRFALNQHIFRVESDDVPTDMLYWILRSVTAYVESQAHGIIGMVHITKGDLGAIPIPIPPHDEASRIVAFLGRETAKLDALVAEQQRLIALLREKRQAVISHAVTRGLDQGGAVKQSAAEWTSHIPVHWDECPIKYLVGLRSGGTPDKSNTEYWDGDIPWASAKDLKREYLVDTEDHITARTLEDGAASLVPPGCVLVVVRGMILARRFPVTQTQLPVAINQDLKAVIAGPRIRPDYLAWLLRGSSEATLSRLDEAGHGTKALRMDTWTSMVVPVPPLEEQEQVAQHLTNQTQAIDALICQAERAIALLQERRAALISAAVTGQIDVRAHALAA